MQRNTLIIICILIAHATAAQVKIKFILKSDLKIDTVDVQDISQKEFYSFQYKDTVEFRLERNSINLYNLRYHSVGKMYYKRIWLDTGNIVVKAHTDNSNLIIDTVINSPFYYYEKDFDLKRSEIFKMHDRSAMNTYLLNELRKYIDNPFFYFIAYFHYLDLNQTSKSDLLILKDMISDQKSDLSWFFFYGATINRLNNLLESKNIQLGDFDFKNRQNSDVKPHLDNADFFILDFWFVECAGCVAQHKEIKADYSKLKRRNIAVIGIANDKDYKKWNDYLTKHGYNWDNYLETGKARLTNYLGIHTFPQYVVLNKKGDIISTYSSYADLCKGMKL